jgi:ankyrin repeat protein
MSKLKSSIDLGVVIEWCHIGNNQKVLDTLPHFSIEELNTPYNGGTTILHEAAENGRELIAKALIDLGVDVNIAEDDMQLTALHYAAWTGGSLKVIQMLLEAEADVKALDSLGRTALHYAVGGGAPTEILQLFLDSGIKVNVQDALGKTALDTAIENDHSDAIIFLQSYTKTLPSKAEVKSAIDDISVPICIQKKSTLDACIDGATSASTLVFAEVSAAASFYSGGNDYTAAITGGKAIVAGCIASIIDNAVLCEDSSTLMGQSDDE